ncbi:hypothetical protein KBD71_02490 [Candidatus Woesebacteria bacterium]|nr:hypothetical protein [Candidatus Woesebacteria bacterium]
MAYSVWIAGTTTRTVSCALALLNDPRFEIHLIITPTPKPVGREQQITPNPLHQFATEHQLPVELVQRKIDPQLQEKLQAHARPDFLLVVDFGYIVPQWLLDLPIIAPLNVHPSALPAFRGSSPGQFVLASGLEQSAVTLMVMDAQLDHGPIVAQFPFSVQEDWTASDYYHAAFELVGNTLADSIATFAEKKTSTPQPDVSPTPVARMLKRDDGFIPWDILKALRSGNSSPTPLPIHTLLGIDTTPQTVVNLWRGFHPWPGIWTQCQIGGTQKRVKILACSTSEDRLEITQIQVEGKTPQPFSQVQFDS